MDNVTLKIDSCEAWADAVYPDVDTAWKNLYAGLSVDGEESAPRGHKIRETLGCNVLILNPEKNLVKSSFRGLSPIYLAKEYHWYRNGSRDPKVAPNSKFWQTIANTEDQSDAGLINSNYGHWVYHQDSKFLDKNVFEATVDILKNDPDSRQAIIQIPIMPFRARKDTPCTSSLQFFVRNGKLNMIVYMRSCDVCLGWPIDIFQFTMWQQELAYELKLPVGWCQYIAGSLHLYEEDFIENRGGMEAFRESLQKDALFESITDSSETCNKVNQIFMDDLKELNEKGKEAVLKDSELSGMLDRMKIWRRESM